MRAAFPWLTVFTLGRVIATWLLGRAAPIDLRGRCRRPRNAFSRQMHLKGASDEDDPLLLLGLAGPREWQRSRERQVRFIAERCHALTIWARSIIRDWRI